MRLGMGRDDDRLPSAYYNCGYVLTLGGVEVYDNCELELV